MRIKLKIEANSMLHMKTKNSAFDRLYRSILFIFARNIYLKSAMLRRVIINICHILRVKSRSFVALFARSSVVLLRAREARELLALEPRARELSGKLNDSNWTFDISFLLLRHDSSKFLKMPATPQNGDRACENNEDGEFALERTSKSDTLAVCHFLLNFADIFIENQRLIKETNDTQSHDQCR